MRSCPHLYIRQIILNTSGRGQDPKRLKGFGQLRLLSRKTLGMEAANMHAFFLLGVALALASSLGN